MNTPTTKQLKNFGLTLGIILSAGFGILLPLLRQQPFSFSANAIGISLIILGISMPNMLKYPYILWMYLAEGLGWMNTRIILGLLFFLIISPIALVKRLFNSTDLHLKPCKNTVSYRIKSVDYGVKQMEKPF